MLKRTAACVIYSAGHTRPSCKRPYSVGIDTFNDTLGARVPKLGTETGASRSGVSVSCETVRACEHNSGLREGLDRRARRCAPA